MGAPMTMVKYIYMCIYICIYMCVCMYVSYIHTVYMHFLIETAPTKGPLDGHEMNRKMRQTIYIYMLQTYAKPTPPRIWNDWYEL